MENLTNKIKEEFKAFVTDKVSDVVLTMENKDEWQYHCFNDDYYLIGYYQCSEWLKSHNIGELEGANICIQYEKENFGECYTVYDNTEAIVNMLAYIYGEQWISDGGEEFILNLLEK